VSRQGISLIHTVCFIWPPDSTEPKRHLTVFILAPGDVRGVLGSTTYRSTNRSNGSSFSNSPITTLKQTELNHTHYFRSNHINVCSLSCSYDNII